MNSIVPQNEPAMSAAADGLSVYVPVSYAEVDYLYEWAKSERRCLKTDTAAANAAIFAQQSIGAR
jgi:hypothetical protein